jgi:PhnB protein
MPTSNYETTTTAKSEKIMNTATIDKGNSKAQTKSGAPGSPERLQLHSVTPHLVCAGAADAIEFYKKAFGAVEMARVPAPDGKLIHAMIRIGDSPVMLVDEFPQCGSLGPKSLKGSPVALHLNVEDVDAAADRAVRAGAKITMPVEDMFWGDRDGRLEDPFGHQWSVATHIRDVSPEEIQKAAAEMCSER